MNAEESLGLYRQGRVAWNRWADALLAERRALEEAGEWTGDEKMHRRNAATRAWLEDAAVDFTDHTFDDAHVRLDRFVFPGDAVFRKAQFLNGANFDAATFHGQTDFAHAVFEGNSRFIEAMFRSSVSFQNVRIKDTLSLVGAIFRESVSFVQARFCCDVHFNKSSFEGSADFSHATFLDRAVYWRSEFHETVRFSSTEFRHSADFNMTQFRAAADFMNCRFAGATYFFRSVFRKSSNFRAIQVKGIFSLAESDFGRVPVFCEAHFLEAPVFDEVGLDFERLRRVKEAALDISLSARWRALRKLAEQSHDDERALRFYKAEVISRRFSQDRPWHLRFWVGWLYQAVSDCGLSIARPLSWLACIYLLCSLLYLLPVPGVSSITPDFYSMKCVVGTGHRLTAALSLSLHYTAPFTFLGHPDALKENHLCLYGTRVSGVGSPDGVLRDWGVAAVPPFLHVASALQFLLSSILVFLIVLAIRNHFRIR